jgi:hypothetical protein
VFVMCAERGERHRTQARQGCIALSIRPDCLLATHPLLKPVDAVVVVVVGKFPTTYTNRGESLCMACMHAMPVCVANTALGHFSCAVSDGLVASRQLLPRDRREARRCLLALSLHHGCVTLPCHCLRHDVGNTIVIPSFLPKEDPRSWPVSFRAE